jgi:hypothetical protein
MRLLKVSIIFLILILPYGVLAEVKISPQWQSSTEAVIRAPTDGQAVQGGVILLGSTGMEGFLSYEVDFTYANNPPQTWFLVQESAVPVQDGILAVWDTTTITDGEYSLRLKVNLLMVRLKKIVEGRACAKSPMKQKHRGQRASLPVNWPCGTSEIARMTETPRLTHPALLHCLPIQRRSRRTRLGSRWAREL